MPRNSSEAVPTRPLSTGTEPSDIPTVGRATELGSVIAVKRVEGVMRSAGPVQASGTATVSRAIGQTDGRGFTIGQAAATRRRMPAGGTGAVFNI